MDYVVGFAFNQAMTAVALIKKNRPAWQAGKCNGIGGKVEQGETPIQAMVREFREETGVFTSEEEWRELAELKGVDSQNEIFTVSSFFTNNEDIFRYVEAITDEEIIHVHIEDIASGKFHEFVPSVPWLVFLAKDENMRNNQMKVKAIYACS